MGRVCDQDGWDCVGQGWVPMGWDDVWGEELRWVGRATKLGGTVLARRVEHNVGQGARCWRI